MKSKNLLLLTIVSILSVLLFHLISINDNNKIHFEESLNETPPESKTSSEEQKVNIRRSKSLQLNRENTVFAKRTLSNSSYANNKIQGVWEQQEYIDQRSNAKGYRTIYAAYDKENDNIYAISYAGHLYKIHKNEENPELTTWELLNSSHSFMSEGNQKSLEVLNKQDKSPVLIRAYNNLMQYSEDEGKNWNNANGVSFQETYDKTVKAKHNNQTRLVSLIKSNNNHKAIVTFDGMNYVNTNYSSTYNQYHAKIIKPTNSNDIYIIQREMSNSVVSVYRMRENETSFTLINQVQTSISSLYRVFGTKHNNQFYLYIAHDNKIYLSTNEGANWQVKRDQSYSTNQGNNDVPRTVHPNKPNVLFKGYLDLYISNDEGASFQSTTHYTGWDVRFMKMFTKNDGSHFHFIGNDFGSFMSYTPDIATSYITLNGRSSHMMIYDSDASNTYHTTYAGTQDRGSRGFSNEETSITEEVRSSDGLRVIHANQDQSIWTLMYFGTLFRSNNIAFYNSFERKEIKYHDGNWKGTVMVASPNSNEDAVYLGGNNQLHKFTYNPNTKAITKDIHQYDFGQTITGFGYDHLNPSNWYVSVKDGTFYRSTNGGTTFQQSNYTSTLPQANDSASWRREQHVIKTSKNIPGRVYYAGVGNIFLISNDGGLTFTNHTQNLNVYRFRDFAVTDDDKYIFAACALGGIWVYVADENRWYEMNDSPIPYVDFTSVEYLPSTNEVIFGTYGFGMMTLKLDQAGNLLTDNQLQPKNLTATYQQNETVNLSWDAPNNNDFTEFSIYVSKNNEGFTKYTTLPKNQTTFTHPISLYEPNYQYRIAAEYQNQPLVLSNETEVDITNRCSVDTKNWTIVDVSSRQNETYYSAKNAIDNDLNTYWHTQWSPRDYFPHYITIDMKEELAIEGLKYITRRDGQQNGNIKDYELYVSSSLSDFGNPVQTGSFNDPNENIIEFNAKVGRYLKLVSTSSQNGSIASNIAKLDICVTQQFLSNQYTKIPLKLIVSPNPVTNQFTISGLQKETKYSIYNMNGKLMSKGAVDVNMNTVELKSLLSGIYFINLVNEEYSEVLKLIKI